MSQRLTVSVALCTHNGAGYLREQLVSIVEQDYPVTQIVVGDDASSDATLAIVAEVAETAPHIQWIVKPRTQALGVTANFEDTIAACTSDVTVLCDQDDVWETHKVKRLVEVLEAKGAVAVATDAALIDHQGERLGETLWARYGVRSGDLEMFDQGLGWKALLRRNLVTGATMAIVTDVAHAAAPYPRAWLHDEWLAIVAASSGGLVMLEEELTRYRIHADNVVGARKRGLRLYADRLTEDGRARNGWLLRRASELDAWAEGRGQALPHGFRDATRGKVSHERRRSSLSTRRILRLLPVARGVLARDYWRYGLGLSDIARDAVQPLKGTTTPARVARAHGVSGAEDAEGVE